MTLVVEDWGWTYLYELILVYVNIQVRIYV